MFRVILEPSRLRWPIRIVAAVCLLLVLLPSIFGLYVGDVFYALVEWPMTLVIMGLAMGPGRRVYAFFEFKLRRVWLGWRQGPGTVRMLAVWRKPLHPVWFGIGLASYPVAAAWNALRELHGGWWPLFAGLATIALLLVLSHWEFTAERADASQITDEVERRFRS